MKRVRLYGVFVGLCDLKSALTTVLSSLSRVSIGPVSQLTQLVHLSEKQSEGLSPECVYLREDITGEMDRVAFRLSMVT